MGGVAAAPTDTCRAGFVAALRIEYEADNLHVLLKFTKSSTFCNFLASHYV